MNVEVTFDEAAAIQRIKDANKHTAAQLGNSLTEIFKTKISTPEQIYEIYDLLKLYEYFAGEKYKIPFEENTIV